jgi:lipoprotein-anchoring transpeptidase ErfK/SrfK
MPGCTYAGKRYASCTINVLFNDSTWRGALSIVGKNTGEASGTVLLTANVVGGPHTPVGSFHASYWEEDHVSTKYGSLADTPYSKTKLGGNAFGPYQLHIRELESRGIYIHGTMGPRWNPSTELNALISPTSHGCVRMANTDNIILRKMIPEPAETPIVISKKGPDK